MAATDTRHLRVVVTDEHQGTGLSDLRSQIDKTDRRFSRFSGMLGAFTRTGGAVFGLMSAGAVLFGIKMASSLEGATVAFTQMLGSGTKAKRFLDELQSFAAKTPFEFLDLTVAAQRLMGMGFAAQDVIPTLRAVGDAVSATGGGKEQIALVVRALGQMKLKGKVAGEELMQLSEAGVPATRLLADAMGVTTGQLTDMIRKGLVPADAAVKAIVDGMENGTPHIKGFGGMMAAQAETIQGKWSNLMDTLKANVAKFVLMAKPAMVGLVDAANKAFTNFFAGLSGTGGKEMTGFSSQLETAKTKLANLQAQASKGLGGGGDGLGDVVREGEVSAKKWNELMAAGWKGDPNDKMEALHRPKGGKAGKNAFAAQIEQAQKDVDAAEQKMAESRGRVQGLLYKAGLGIRQFVLTLKTGKVDAEGFVGATQQIGLAVRQVFMAVKHGAGLGAEFSNWEKFGEILRRVFFWVRDDGIPAVKEIGRQLLALGKSAGEVAGWLIQNLGPAVQFVAEQMITAGKFIFQVTGWISEHKAAIIGLGVAYGVLKVAVMAYNLSQKIAMSGGLLGYIKHIKIVAAVLKVWTAVQWVLNSALLASPITWIVLGLAALVVGLIFAWKHSEKFRAIVTGAFEAIKRVVGAVIGWFQTAIPKIGESFMGFVTTIKELPGKLVDIAVRAMHAFGAAITTGVNATLEFFRKLPERMLHFGLEAMKFFLNAWKLGSLALLDFVVKLPGRILDGLFSLLALMISFTIKVWKAFAQKTNEIVLATVAWLKGLPQRILSALAALGKTVVDIANKSWDSFRKKTIEIVVALTAWIRALPSRVISALATLGGLIRTLAQTAWTGFKNKTTEIALALLAWIKLLPGRVIGGLATLGGLIRTLAHTAWTGFVEKTKEIVRAGIKWMTGVPAAMGKALAGVGTAVANAVKSAVGSAFNWINNHVIGNINKITTQFGLKIPNLPTFETGGVIPGQVSARDNVLIAARTGEGILIPEAVKGLGGERGIHQLNAMFRRGNKQGYGALQEGGFASGGVVPRLHSWVTGGDGSRAKMLRSHINRGGSFFEDFSFRGASPFYKLGNDRLASHFWAGHRGFDFGGGGSRRAIGGWLNKVIHDAIVGIQQRRRIQGFDSGGVVGSGFKTAFSVLSGATRGKGTAAAVANLLEKGAGYALNALLTPVPRMLRAVMPNGGIEDLIAGDSGIIEKWRTSAKTWGDTQNTNADGSWNNNFRGGFSPAAIKAVQSWIRRQEFKPYVWAAAGPGSYDCSGLVGAVYGLLTGRGGGNGQRYFTTSSIGPGFRRGLGTFTIGNSPSPVGHMAGNLAGLPFEATPPRVKVGSGAASVRGFAQQLTLDSGGYLPPGFSSVYNGTGRNERVLSPRDNPPQELHVHFHGLITDPKSTAAEVHRLLKERRRDLAGASLGLG